MVDNLLSFPESSLHLCLGLLLHTTVQNMAGGGAALISSSALVPAPAIFVYVVMVRWSVRLSRFIQGSICAAVKDMENWERRARSSAVVC